MGFRRRQERREKAVPGPRGGGGATRYKVRQGMFTIGDDLWIETHGG